MKKWNEAFVIVKMVLPVVLRMNDFYLHEWLNKMPIYFIMYFAQKSSTFFLYIAFFLFYKFIQQDSNYNTSKIIILKEEKNPSNIECKLQVSERCALIKKSN